MQLTTVQIDLLQQMLADGYISVQKHPDADLYIYNYTAQTQYEYLWNDITLMCRGLILDANKNIVARPFTKFFNYEEVQATQMPNEPFDVYEKMDGSLGILYWLNDKPYIATRGSFTSEQALAGTAILHEHYAHLFATLNRDATYLFEIIYPENRIVVNYGDMRDIVLTAIIDNATGKDLAIDNTGFTTAKHYDGIADFKLLKQAQDNNREGYVVKFRSGFRIKIKFEEYLRIHRIVTQVSSISIWEYLSQDLPLDKIIEQVPDEFYNWVKQTVADLQQQYAAIEAQCHNDYKELEDKKATAMYFQTCDYPAILFAMYNKKNYGKIIWKLIRPTFTKPFSKFTSNDH
ncbi:MAG: hypothetical protein RL660_2311 [Bacteroidota bacterium]|jgi:RNA ligase